MYFISYFTQFFNRSYIASMFIRRILNVLDTVHNIIMASIPGKHRNIIFIHKIPTVVCKY